MNCTISKFLYLFWISVLALCTSNCVGGDTAVISGIIQNSPFTSVSLERYPENTPDAEITHFPISDGRFSIKIDLKKTELVRVLNSYLIVRPGENIVLKLDGSHPDIYSSGFHEEFLKFQKELDAFNREYYSSFSKNFHAKKYLRTLDTLHKIAYRRLVYFTERNQEPNTEKQLKSYYNGMILFFLTKPFFNETLDRKERDRSIKFFYKKLLRYFDDSLDTGNENLGIAITNFYTKALFSKEKGFDRILHSNFWPRREQLRKLIAAKFVSKFYRNTISLNEDELKELKSILCATADDLFCEFYSRIEFGKLNISDIAAADSIMTPDNSVLSLQQFVTRKNTYLYFWASWCAPCIEFIKKIDFAKVESDSKSDLVFMSIDEDVEAWKARSSQLGIPREYNFLLKNVKESEFKRRLRFETVPFVIKINENKIQRVNVSKNDLQKYIRVELTENR